jgi:hypothetical protein
MNRTPTHELPVRPVRFPAGADVSVRSKVDGRAVFDRPPTTALPATCRVQLTGLGAERGRGRSSPTLIERREEDFVRALMDHLRSEERLEALVNTSLDAKAAPGTPLKLYPPIQRVHQLVIVEACCSEPGYPRLDPRRIAGAGLVVRRVRDGGHLAWAKVGPRAVGWQTLDARSSGAVIGEDDDPDPAQRRPRLSAGHPVINAGLAANLAVRGPDVPGEHVVPLHMLPPDICESLKRTLLFGWLPVGVDDAVDDDSPSGALPPLDSEDITKLQQHLSGFLRAHDELIDSPLDQWPTGEQWQELQEPEDAEAQTDHDRHAFVTMLLQLRNEFDAFGESTESRAVAGALQSLRTLHVSDVVKRMFGEKCVDLLVRKCLDEDVDLTSPQSISTRVRKELAQVIDEQFPFGQPGTVNDFLVLAKAHIAPALPLLQWAAAALFYAPDSSPTDAAPPALPDYWLPVTDQQAKAIAAACAASAVARFDRLFVAGRSYSQSGERYAARCFIRVACDKGCPPELVWSAYSAEFTVAPWWEPSGVKPRVVPLPDPFDRTLLRQLRPNAAFQLPSKLANLMSRAALKKMRDGEAPQAGGPDIAWICGFNIPIITLCAVIVLSIFLQLLNIVFWWLPFVKTCIPLPRAKP